MTTRRHIPIEKTARAMKRVRTAFDLRNASERSVAHGILSAFKSCENLFVDLDRDTQELNEAESAPDCVGLILSADLPHARQICAANQDLPIVVVGCGRDKGDLIWAGPRIDIDDATVGTVGAQHLIDCGFQYFAFCSYPSHQSNAWCRERGLAFAKHVSARGRACEVHVTRDDPFSNAHGLNMALRIWLASLPKPVGIMAADDRLAHRILLACQEIGLSLPDQVAVLGVGNDELIGSLSSDFLSSIDLPVQRQGSEAAALLRNLINCEAASPLQRRLPPVQVIRRGSTDVMAIQDAAVLRAMQFIRDFAGERITPHDVADHVAMSRSYLDARFRESLGCTVFQAIQKCRRDRALDMLAHADYTTKQIAEMVGYSSTQHLSTDIRIATGRTPGQYRDEAGDLSSRRTGLPRAADPFRT